MAIDLSQPPKRRPSLYAAIRLARLVLSFRERLKSRIRLRNSLAKPLSVCHSESFKVHAHGQTNRFTKCHYKCCNHVGGKNDDGHTQYLELKVLLDDLDLHAQPGRLSLSTIAAQDKLFLHHDIYQIAMTETKQLSHFLDLTTGALHRLQRWSGSRKGYPDDRLDDEKYAANLEHLLRCFQQATQEALIQTILRLVEADILHWHQYWQKLTQSLDGWFVEWPGGRHPLSTTWPWNIKPCLVILWGVCWMFFGNGEAMMRLPRGGPQPRMEDIIGTRQVSLPNGPQEVLETGAGYDINTFGHTDISFLQVPEGEDSRRASISRFPDYYSTLPDSASTTNDITESHISSFTPFSDLFPDSPNGWPPTQRIDSQDLDSFLAFPDLGNRVNELYDHAEPDVPDQLQRHSNEITTSIIPGPGLMGEILGYPPSPKSDNSQQRRLIYSPISPITDRTTGMDPVPSPGNRGSQEPPKNEEGQICCTHTQCQNPPVIFLRKCEWTKHMDKHNRPYVCEEPGCEKIQGFTYSGGLLRHQREVHRQHGGPKEPRMCPHPDCKRSVGVGFSRKENLYEHLRRVHRGAGEQNGAVPGKFHRQEISQKPVGSVGSEPQKRRKDFNDSEEDELSALMKPQKRIRARDNNEDHIRSRESDALMDLRKQVMDLQKQVMSSSKDIQLCNEKCTELAEVIERTLREQH